MIDPITPGIQVSWQGKTYTVQLTLGALAGASRVLRIPILESNGLDGLPELAARAVIVFALLHRRFPNITIQQCEDAVMVPKYFTHYADVATQAMISIKPYIDELVKAVAPPENPSEAADNQALTSSGGDSGPSQS